MIAKLIAYAGTRDEAIDRLCRAINEYYIKGIKNTLEFGKWAVQTEPFRSGNFDTKFIEKYFKPEYLVKEDVEAEQVAALLAAHVWEKERKQNSFSGAAVASVNKWKINRN